MKAHVDTGEDTSNAKKLKFPFNQIFAAMICNLASLNSGMGIGWLSPALPQMLAPGGLLSTLDSEEANTLAYWMAGIFPLAALACTPLATWLMEARGRKACGLITGVPFAVNSIIILSSNNIYHLLIGRFIMGFGIALSLINIPTFIGEISETRVRGVLGAGLTIFYTIGITLSYIVGGFISYYAGAMLMLVCGVLNIVLFFFVPETPAWLVRNKQYESAAKSISWLWRIYDIQDPSVQKELEKLKNEVNVVSPSKLQAAKQLVLSKPLRRGFLLCLMMLFIQSWMGMIAVHSYSVSIFLESGAADLTAEEAATVYGCIQILGAISVTTLVEHAGRKVLMAASSLSVSVCMYSMGAYFYLKSQGVDLSMVQWLPVVSLTLCVFTYTIGAGSIPFILVSDLLANEVRGVATMFSIQVSLFNTFLTLRFFAPAVAYFGSHTVFFFFGSSSAVGGLLTILLLQETKRKSPEQIRQLLSK